MLSVQLMLLELPPPSRPEKAAAVQLIVIAYCCHVVDCIVVLFRTFHSVVCIVVISPWIFHVVVCPGIYRINIMPRIFHFVICSLLMSQGLSCCC